VALVESSVFTRRLRELAKSRAPEVLDAIQLDLLSDPESGRVVAGLGGIRKARAAAPNRGKGKRGGFRYLYLEVPSRAHIHLVYMFGKDEQEDLNAKERAVLREMAERIKEQA